MLNFEGTKVEIHHQGSRKTAENLVEQLAMKSFPETETLIKTDETRKQINKYQSSYIPIRIVTNKGLASLIGKLAMLTSTGIHLHQVIASKQII